MAASKVSAAARKQVRDGKPGTVKTIPLEQVEKVSNRIAKANAELLRRLK